MLSYLAHDQYLFEYKYADDHSKGDFAIRQLYLKRFIMNNPEYSIFEMSYYFSFKSLVLKFSLVFFL